MGTISKEIGAMQSRIQAEIGSLDKRILAIEMMNVRDLWKAIDDRVHRSELAGITKNNKPAPDFTPIIDEGASDAAT
jgi:hypothetical protein